MSKFGWSYPPGVTESMLPGNSKEEQEAEAFYDTFYDKMAELATVTPATDTVDAEYHLKAEALDKFVEWAWKQMGEAYHRGYTDGMGDEAFAQEMKAQQHQQDKEEEQR